MRVTNTHGSGNWRVKQGKTSTANPKTRLHFNEFIDTEAEDVEVIILDADHPTPLSDRLPEQQLSDLRRGAQECGEIAGTWMSAAIYTVGHFLLSVVLFIVVTTWTILTGLVTSIGQALSAWFSDNDDDDPHDNGPYGPDNHHYNRDNRRPRRETITHSSTTTIDRLYASSNNLRRRPLSARRDNTLPPLQATRRLNT